MTKWNNSVGDIIEIIERDASMRKTGSWKFNADDKKLANSIFAYFIKKYNFNPEVQQKKEEGKDFLNLNAEW